jgi:DNA-binding NarL/FixJ family response regulator
MRYPQLIVFEADGRVAAALGPAAEERGWALRQPRRIDGALGLLQRGGPNVLVIRAGRDLEREFTLLDRASEQFPEAAVVVLLDSPHPKLVGLAWDLGAHCVLTADVPRGRLVELVESLLGVPDERVAGGR